MRRNRLLECPNYLYSNQYIALHFLVGVRCQMHKPCKAVQVSLLPHFGGVAPGGKKTCHQYLIRDPGENFLWHCLNMLGALACCFVQHLSTIIVGNPKNRLASCKAQQLVAGCESAKIQSIEKGNVPNQDDWN